MADSGAEASHAEALRRLAPDGLYLERQKRMCCAIHATNNLLQTPTYDMSSFDDLIAQLPQFGGRWASPYKSAVSYLGHFSASELHVPNFYGLMLNLKSRSRAASVLRMFRLAQGRHWLAVVPLQHPASTASTAPQQLPPIKAGADKAAPTYAWLDSVKTQPETLTEGELVARLQREIDRNGVVYVATRQATAQSTQAAPAERP
ncbi:uncharacterized protein MONBRDRAFT_31347 [Monosiga brevicollis MX1]|uniref:ubiquitinyl hydrolase 1 n=1 Tax=Monosiga brevicollis TaxID=81824 RepID=A9URE1_MONBE|nr:uncharacterized protein MONBRDRAFT_31347 [Monosiga brevicollis MX1]EDQ92228.1 predicted protein [Monosiga brevicollis MX1]|eukprot:XP_001743514.1 hypothetical protein [Monosiga brevicollis MX1]